MRIELLGTTFSVRSDEDPDYLAEVVEHYRGKVAEIQRAVGTSDPLKIAILAGILAADEYLKLTGSRRRQSGEAMSIAETLIAELSAALGENDETDQPGS